MKRPIVVAGFIACVALAVVLGTQLGRTPRPDPAPLLLLKAQALGDLHTARHTIQVARNHETSIPVTDWVEAVPGVAGVVRGATLNRAVMVTTVQVEAGVDLTQAKLVGDRLVLPAARIYPPLADSTLVDHRPGLLWRDDGIALKGDSEARRQAVQAARQAGIERQATDEAVARLSRLARDLGAEVKVTVRPAG